MVEMIEANYHLLPVINRFGLKLGFRDKHIEQLCHEHEVNVEFFLAIINTFHNKDYFAELELKSFSPLLIVNYLRKTHHYYINYVLPKIEKLLESIIQSSRQGNTQLHVIHTFYQKYKTELLLHIQEEEELVFPHVEHLINNRHGKANYTMKSFEAEHSNVDIKLNDLKSLILKYIVPDYDENICNDFLIALYRFERDIKDHARIEDKILLPRVVEIEKQHT